MWDNFFRFLAVISRFLPLVILCHFCGTKPIIQAVPSCLNCFLVFSFLLRIFLLYSNVDVGVAVGGGGCISLVDDESSLGYKSVMKLIITFKQKTSKVTGSIGGFFSWHTYSHSPLSNRNYFQRNFRIFHQAYRMRRQSG